MVKHFARVSPVEVEVSVREVHEGNNSDEQEQVRVVSVATGIEGIVTDLITVGQVVDVVFLFPGVAASVRRERVLVVVQGQVVLVTVVVGDLVSEVARGFESFDCDESLIAIGDKLVVAVSLDDGAKTSEGRGSEQALHRGHALRQSLHEHFL